MPHPQPHRPPRLPFGLSRQTQVQIRRRDRVPHRRRHQRPSRESPLQPRRRTVDDARTCELTCANNPFCKISLTAAASRSACRASRLNRYTVDGAPPPPHLFANTAQYRSQTRRPIGTAAPGLSPTPASPPTRSPAPPCSAEGTRARQSGLRIIAAPVRPPLASGMRYTTRR
jgi:hypothetical protein